MSKFSDLLSDTVRIIPIEEHPKDIVPIPDRSVKLWITESVIENDPEKDYAIVTSETAYGDYVVETWIAEKSGLDGWHVIPGYPYLNADKLIEWKVRRLKDW